MSPPPPHMLSRIIGHGARNMGTRMIIGSQLLLKAKHESTCRKMARLTTAERMRIFQIVSIDPMSEPARRRSGRSEDANGR